MIVMTKGGPQTKPNSATAFVPPLTVNKDQDTSVRGSPCPAMRSDFRFPPVFQIYYRRRGQITAKMRHLLQINTILLYEFMMM